MELSPERKERPLPNFEGTYSGTRNTSTYLPDVEMHTINIDGQSLLHQIIDENGVHEFEEAIEDFDILDAQSQKDRFALNYDWENAVWLRHRTEGNFIVYFPKAVNSDHPTLLDFRYFTGHSQLFKIEQS